MNATNPKIGLYYATVLPNFLSKDAWQGLYITMMGLTHNVLGFCWFMTFAFLLNRGVKMFDERHARANITLVTGLALVAFCLVALFYVFRDSLPPPPDPKSP